MNPIARVVSALRERGHNPTRAGKEWRCRCPAHDDSTPSLNITTGDDGRALLNCRAGCTTKAVCEAIGLSLADLFATDAGRLGERNGRSPRSQRLSTSTGTRPRHSNGISVDVDGKKGGRTFPAANEAVADLERRHGPRSASWVYHCAKGELVGMVLRWDSTDGKKSILPVSRLADGSGWIIGGMPELRPLYGLPALLATKPGERVYVTEGEKAADAARAVGLVATTSPHGSKSAGKADWSHLAGRDVVIMPDNDKPGEQYAQDVARLARAAGAKSVRVARLIELWAGMPVGGDMADLLEHRGGDAAEMATLGNEVATLADAATPVKPAPMPIDGAPVLQRMSDIERREVCWLWDKRIPRKRISLLVGRPGEGKSMVTMDLVSRVTTGRDWPDGSPCTQGSVVLVAGEDDPHDTIRPRLDAHGADVTRVHLLQSVIRIGRGGAAIESAFTLADLTALESALAQITDCAMVIIDPIGSFIGGGVDAHRDNEVRAVLAPLAALAQRSGAAILLVAHQRKGAASHADDLVLGSRAFTGIARSVLHLMIDPDDNGRRLLLPGKMNLSSPAAGLAFRISGNPARVEYEPDPVAMTANDALAAQAGRAGGRRTERDDAAEWLRDYLSDGPRLARDVLAEAKAAGLAKRTIERAKLVVGVRARKETFSGGWVWELDTPCEERQPRHEDCHNWEVGGLGARPDESCENHTKVANLDGVASYDGLGGDLGSVPPLAGDECGDAVTAHTHELGPLLMDLGHAGIEITQCPTEKGGLRIMRHGMAADLPPDLAARLWIHRAAVLGLLADGYTPDSFTEEEYILGERLGMADELGLPTHLGAPAWLVAVGESMVIQDTQVGNIDILYTV